MSPTPTLLDCDPGHDDAIAILLALRRPEVELLGITTVAGNQTLEKTDLNAPRVLELRAARDVPVAAGAGAPLCGAEARGERPRRDRPRWPALSAPRSPSSRAHGSTDPRRADPRPRPADHAVATGPLTNVALAAFAREPDLPSRLQRIVLMGGSIGEGKRPNAY